MKSLPSTPLVWFGVLGGAIAWAVQFVANLYLTFAQCNQTQTHRSLPLHQLEIGISVAAIVVGLAAEGVSVSLFRQTDRIEGVTEEELRGEGSPPPTGRINFLAMVGVTVNFLALAIIAMTAIGAPLLAVCQQS